MVTRPRVQDPHVVFFATPICAAVSGCLADSLSEVNGPGWTTTSVPPRSTGASVSPLFVRSKLAALVKTVSILLTVPARAILRCRCRERAGPCHCGRRRGSTSCNTRKPPPRPCGRSVSARPLRGGAQGGVGPISGTHPPPETRGDGLVGCQNTGQHMHDRDVLPHRVTGPSELQAQCPLPADVRHQPLAVAHLKSGELSSERDLARAGLDAKCLCQGVTYFSGSGGLRKCAQMLRRHTQGLLGQRLFVLALAAVQRGRLAGRRGRLLQRFRQSLCHQVGLEEQRPCVVVLIHLGHPAKQPDVRIGRQSFHLGGYGTEIGGRASHGWQLREERRRVGDLLREGVVFAVRR